MEGEEGKERERGEEMVGERGRDGERESEVKIDRDSVNGEGIRVIAIEQEE